jgi:chitodextrinase
MTQKIQIKRGLKNNLPLLEEGELALTTDAKEVYIGSNTGNVELPNRAYIDTRFGALTTTLDQILTRLTIVEGGSPADTTPPLNVTNLTESGVTATGVTLNWTASTSGGIGSYDIYNGSTLLANITGTTYNISGLSASTTYTFSVRSRDTSGNTASGTSITVTTSSPGTLPTFTSSFVPFEPPLASNQWVADSTGKVLNMTADQFHANFYDPYIGTSANGYTVTKTSLGKDQSGAYDIWEYDFKPASFTKTVLLSSGLHPYELPSTFGLAHLVKHLMTSPYLHEGFKYIKENVRLKIIAIQNPWGWNQNPKKYGNVNGVNMNRNWDSVAYPWAAYPVLTDEWNQKGSAPFSEAETRILRDWNLNNPTAEFWIDCHTGLNAGTYDTWVFYARTSDGNFLYNKMHESFLKLNTRFQTKYGRTANAFEELGVTDDPKGPYLLEQLNRPSMTIEFCAEVYGNNLNNEGIDITEYEVAIACHVFYLLASPVILPNNVTNLSASNITQTSLTLSWTASSTSNVSYDIYRGSTFVANVAGMTYNVTNLTAGTTYIFTVKTKDSSGNVSSGTGIQVVTTASADTTPPLNVTNFSASNITQTSLTLSWTASTSSDIASYDIYNGSTLLANTPTTTYNVTGLSQSTTYTFWVKAKDTVGNAASGTSVQATTITPAQTTYVSDTFTRTNATSLGTSDTGQTWSTLNGASVFGTNGTQAYIATTRGATDVALVDAGVANCTIEVDTPAHLPNTRIIFRATDIDNLFIMDLGSSDVTLYLWELNQTDVTLFAGTAFNATIIDHVKVILNGTNIQVFFNNGTTATINVNSSVFQSVTKHGIGGWNTNNIRFDNYTIKS